MRLKKFIASGVNGLTEKDAVVFNQSEKPLDGKELFLDMSKAWDCLYTMQTNLFTEVLLQKSNSACIRFTCVFEGDAEEDLIYSVETRKEDCYFKECVGYGSADNITRIIYSAEPEDKGDSVSYYKHLSPYKKTRVTLPGLVVFQLCRSDRLALSIVSAFKDIVVRGAACSIPDELYRISEFISNNRITTYCGNRTVVEDNWRVLNVF